MSPKKPVLHTHLFSASQDPPIKLQSQAAVFCAVVVGEVDASVAVVVVVVVVVAFIIGDGVVTLDVGVSCAKTAPKTVTK